MVVLVFLVQLPFRLHGVSPMDEGGVLQFAADILRGRHLYSDAVVYAFPGVFWLTAAVFAVAGTTVEVARTTAALVFAGTCGVVYLLARWSHGRAAAVGLVGLMLCYRVWAYPHWQMLNYSSVAVGLALAAVWCTGEGLARAQRVLVVAGGVVAALAVLTKQDSGGAVAVALTVGTLVAAPAGSRARMAGAFVGGGLVVAAVATAWVAAQGYLGDLVREAILAPLHGAQTFEYLGRPALWPLVGQDAELRRRIFNYVPPILFDTYGVDLLRSAVYRRTAAIDVALKLVYHLPWLVVVAGAASLRTPAARTPRSVVLVLAGLAFLVAFDPPRDWAHLIVLYPITLLLAARCVAPLCRRPAGAAVAWAGLAVAGVASVAVVRAFVAEYATPIHSAAGTLYARRAQAEPLQGVLDAVATAPHDVPMASLPYDPLVDFLAARPGVSRYYLVWPVEQNARRDDEVVAALAAEPRALVVYSANEFPQFPRFRQYAAPLFARLVDAYDVDRVFGGDPGGATILLLRRTAPPQGASLLGPRLDAARVVVEPPPATEPARASLVAEDRWPFNRVARVSTVPAATVAVRFAVVPQGADHFRAACGINPERFGESFVPPVDFTVAVAPPDGSEEELFAAHVDALRRPEDRRWIPIDVDLTRWAGRDIELVLRVRGPSAAPPDFNLAGWADPRIESASER